MVLKFAIHTLIELAVILLLIYGFCCEDKLIEFEDRLKAKFRSGQRATEKEKNHDN